MKKLLCLIIPVLFLYSCTSQKEVVTTNEKVQIPVVTVTKKLSVDIEKQVSMVNVSLRGVSVVDSLTAWASGAKGTFLKTTDGGETWVSGKVKGFEGLDFRDIEAFDKNTAILMSTDCPAYFFKTTDGGKSWKKKYNNKMLDIFFDGLAFWDDKNGIAFSDPIDGKLYVVATKNGGESWGEIPEMNIPSVMKKEGAFAASGTAIAVYGKDLVWIGTGGGEKARIFKSEDGGCNWRVSDAKIKAGSASRGVFSVCFKNELDGVIVGGDYKDDKDNTSNCAVTDDGGLSWTLIEKDQPYGFRSCVAWNQDYNIFIAVGTSGADFSANDGKTWTNINSQNYNSISFAKKGGVGYLVGDKGAVARVKISYSN